MSKKHFTYTERIRLEEMRKAGYSVAVCAERLGKCRQTVYNEIKRGAVEQLDTHYRIYRIYSADKAQLDADYKATAKGAPIKLGNDYALAQYIETSIVKEKQSPYAVAQQINGKLSPRTIYNYIYHGVFLGLHRSDLPGKPRKKKPVPEKRPAYRNALKPSITDRLKKIAQRADFGHWEMDTVVGHSKGENRVLLVLTERKTRFELVFRICRKNAKSVVKVLDKLQRQLGTNFTKVFQTITVDNGSEFSDYKGMTKNERTEVYYCHPYSSWERGSNENANRIIRRWFPKGTDFNKVTNREVSFVQNWMNNYPRKLLNGKTPIALFRAECTALGIHTAL